MCQIGSASVEHKGAACWPSHEALGVLHKDSVHVSLPIIMIAGSPSIRPPARREVRGCRYRDVCSAVVQSLTAMTFQLFSDGMVVVYQVAHLSCLGTECR